MKQFKAESKRLLDLMINSIYTNKEIFLRELLSNASDAIDKLYYQSLTDKSIKVNEKDLCIKIEIDKENRLLKIIDTGIGMNKEELENNLGMIAKSGSLQFKEENEKKKDVNIIGQFGVGFYSSFMVSDDVTVISKKYNEEDAYKWESTGAEGYTITKDEKDTYGTTIILKIKSDNEEYNYSDFLDTYTIETLVKKYSDYIRYPIKMDIEHQHKKEGTEKQLEDILQNEDLLKNAVMTVETIPDIEDYVVTLLQKAIDLRNTISGRRYSDIILTAQKMIREEYMSEEISLNVVAARVCMSPSYFSTIFSKETGKTFIEYLTEVRMEKAKEYLVCTNRKTSDIAFEIGYKDPHYFSFLFKKTQGCTPKEYRTSRKEW